MNDDATAARFRANHEDLAEALEAAREAATYAAVSRAHVRAFFLGALIWLPLGLAIGWGMR